MANSEDAAAGGAAGDLPDAGVGTGGAGTGGARTGGASTGVVATGGAGSGGVSTGTARTGGASAGGTTGRGTGGTPASAFLELDGSRMDFDSVALGSSPVAHFTLTNRGASASGVPVVRTETASYPAGTPPPVVVTGCEAALPALASCVLTLTVTPPKLGLFQAYVRISADPGTSEAPGSRLSIYVVGWAIGFEVASPWNIDLGDVPPGVLVRRSITVTALIDLSDLTVKTSGEDIAINVSASTCTAALARGASCVAAIDFVAPTVGWKRDIVAIKAGGDLGQTVSIELVANVTSSSKLAIEPKAPETYTCVFEQTSPPVVFTVTNLGDTTTGTIVSDIVGASVGDFAITETDCTVLAPQATCTLAVVCRPPMSSATADRTAILSVTDGDTHLSVPLNGKVTFGP